jgi:hypothetical protein
LRREGKGVGAWESSASFTIWCGNVAREKKEGDTTHDRIKQQTRKEKKGRYSTDHSMILQDQAGLGGRCIGPYGRGVMVDSSSCCCYRDVYA